jgi:hypothetical protein
VSNRTYGTTVKRYSHDLSHLDGRRRKEQCRCMLEEITYCLAAVVSWWFVAWTGVGAASLELWQRIRRRSLTFPQYLKYYAVMFVFIAPWVALHQTYSNLQRVSKQARLLEPMTLDQETRFRAVLARGKGQGCVAYVTICAQNNGPLRFAHQVLASLSDNQWSSGSNSCNGGTGVGVRLLIPEIPSKSTSLVEEAFENAGIPFLQYPVRQSSIPAITVQIGEPTP